MDSQLQLPQTSCEFFHDVSLAFTENRYVYCLLLKEIFFYHDFCLVAGRKMFVLALEEHRQSSICQLIHFIFFVLFSNCIGEITPVSCIVGGILAQEIIKVLTPI